MSEINYIEISQLCTHYEIEVTFFQSLNEYGLIELVTVEERPCIAEDKLTDLEKILRLNRDLEINLEGIDTIIHLLKRVDSLQVALALAKERLKFFEDN
jgi:hypothetical protein